MIARLAQSRSEAGTFAPRDVDDLFDEFALPRPARTSNVLGALEGEKLVIRLKGARGAWKVSPRGASRAQTLAADMDLAALTVEAATAAPVLGETTHPVIPPSLAPPDLIGPLRAFTTELPFEHNVFGMTRFPQATDDETDEDPVAPALRLARELCAKHGLVFHLASDRQIVDDLWANVAAHMWACKFGIAFFEDRAQRGVNYNLTIEVGSMLVLGRRVAILKDTSVSTLPTDLTGRIYKDIDLDAPDSVATELERWIADDLGLG